MKRCFDSITKHQIEVNEPLTLWHYARARARVANKRIICVSITHMTYESNLSLDKSISKKVCENQGDDDQGYLRSLYATYHIFYIENFRLLSCANVSFKSYLIFVSLLYNFTFIHLLYLFLWQRSLYISSLDYWVFFDVLFNFILQSSPKNIGKDVREPF